MGKLIELIARWFLKLELADLNNQISILTKENVILKEQIEALKSSETTIIEPDKLAETSYGELKILLSPYCSNIYLSDNVYGLTSVEQAKIFSNETRVMAKKWVEEQHDCDEFSFALMGYWNDGLKQFAFGIAWSDKHAFNIFINEKKEIYIVEPQTNKFIPLEEAMKNSLYYPLRVVLI